VTINIAEDVQKVHRIEEFDKYLNLKETVNLHIQMTTKSVRYKFIVKNSE